MSDSNDPACPCDALVFPTPISNAAGQSSISYRVGDYTSFREALLRTQPGEQQLTSWQPTEGDLALQMLEWWAYLADILTFYNERVANDSYLRTAQRADVVARIVALLGYRPRPALGSSGMLAALSSAAVPFTLPQGVPFQSKSTPKVPAQTFEADAATTIYPSGALNGDLFNPIPTPLDAGGVLLGGVVSGVKTNDNVLLLASTLPLSVIDRAFWRYRVGRGRLLDPMTTPPTPPYGQWMTVASVTPQKDPRGRANTQLTWTGTAADLAAGLVQLFAATGSAPNAMDCRVLTGKGQVRLLQRGRITGVGGGLAFHAVTDYVAAALNENQIHLASVVTGIQVGDVVVLAIPTGGGTVCRVTGYQEVIWYDAFVDSGSHGSSPNLTDPTSPASATSAPIPHTVLTVVATTALPTSVAALVLYYGFADIGQVIDTPPTSATGASFQVVSADPLPAPFMGTNGVLPTNVPAFIEDANNQGSSVIVNIQPGPSTQGVVLGNIYTVTQSDPTRTLAAPVRLLYNLFPVSRGKTVLNDVLGNGDATQAGQSFTLKKSPLTYFAGSNGGTLPYRSTLSVSVDGVAWTEVENFVGQSPTARVFITSQDAAGTTTVSFGDGIEGARLTTGTGNVVARYRYGAEAAVPDAASITTVLKSVTGLTTVRNPVQVSGGVDAESPSQSKTAAPTTVLAFGRAISLSDYEAIALQAGATRATAYYTWDDKRGVVLVKVYVGEDQNAVTAVTKALLPAVDPNIPFTVTLPNLLPAQLSLTLLSDPAYDPAAVQLAVQNALLDPASPIFGTGAVIGAPVYESQLAAVCMRVPGVLEVLSFETGMNLQPYPSTMARRITTGSTGLQPNPPDVLQPQQASGPARTLAQRLQSNELHSPGEGGLFVLLPQNLQLNVGSNDHGYGR